MSARRGQVGMTLVELVVAMALTALVGGSTVAMLRTAAAVRDRVDRQMAVQQEACVAARAIVTALRNAHRTPEKDFLLEGVDTWHGDFPADRIRFRAIGRKAVRRGRPESDVREYEFFLSRPEEDDRFAVLMRRTDPTRNRQPDEGGVVEPIAVNVLGLDFSYHDGIDWVDRWRKSNREWPAAIRFQLTAATQTKPRRSFTVVRTVSYPHLPAPKEAEKE